MSFLTQTDWSSDEIIIGIKNCFEILVNSEERLRWHQSHANWRITQLKILHKTFSKHQRVFAEEKLTLYSRFIILDGKFPPRKMKILNINTMLSWDVIYQRKITFARNVSSRDGIGGVLNDSYHCLNKFQDLSVPVCLLNSHKFLLELGLLFYLKEIFFGEQFSEQNKFSLTNNIQRNGSPGHVAMAITFPLCNQFCGSPNLNFEPDNDAEHCLLTEIRKREKILQVQGRDNG